MDENPARPALRASDADREQVARQLHAATADGRLTMVELDDRLRDAYRARTVDELAPLTADLQPAISLSKDAAGTPARTGPSQAWAVMSGTERAGRWLVPERFSVVALMGGARIDLREAVFSQRHITISATAVMAGVDIVVPDDVDVICDGFGLMGTFESRAPQAVAGSRGSVRVTGAAFWGGVTVRPATKRERRKLAR